MRRTLLSLFAVAAVLSAAPLAASAQENGPAVGSTTASLSGASSGHGRGFGIGAATMLVAPTNLLLTWGDSRGVFNIDGLFGLDHSGGVTDLDAGVRFWYHIHASSYADFSLGGGLMVLSKRQGQQGQASRRDRDTDFTFDIGGQIRVFVVPNVALLGSLGLGVYVPDAGSDHLNIGGQTTGTLGVAYFFE